MENGKLKIVINPKYEAWRGWLEQLPTMFEQQGEVIYEERNQLRKMTVDGDELCVKRFHKPRWLNKYIYRLKASKARRSYENGLYLQAHGIGTPEPIAYIEEYEHGGLGYSFLVTRMSELKHMHREFTLDYKPELEQTIRPLARYTARMHNAGIVHLDYSPGNILWDIKDGEYVFEIIDINRMRRGYIGIKEGCKSMRRICARSRFFDIFADEYAAARGFDSAECRKWIHYYRNRFWNNGRKAQYDYD